MSKLCPKIILEGTRLTLKTEIALALNEHPCVAGARRYRYPFPLISAEWSGFSDSSRGRGLINFDPEEEARAMEAYQLWVRMFELLPYCSWVIDRFHLSTQLYQLHERKRFLDFRWLEDRLQALNFRLVFCYRDPDTFEAAREERLKVSGSPCQYDDLSRFVDEQEIMKQLVTESCIESLWVDVSDNNVQAAVGTIAGWLESSGGLYAPGSQRGLYAILS